MIETRFREMYAVKLIFPAFWFSLAVDSDKITSFGHGEKNYQQTRTGHDTKSIFPALWLVYQWIVTELPTLAMVKIFFNKQELFITPFRGNTTALPIIKAISLQ